MRRLILTIVLLGVAFISAVLVICINFLVDILYARLDPRISADS